MTQEKKIPFSIGLYFILFYLIVILFISTSAAVLYHMSCEEELSTLKINQKILIDNAIFNISIIMNDVASDINYLARQNRLQTFLNGRNPTNKEEIENDWGVFGQEKKRYDQIRLLDLMGQEMIRVDFDMISSSPKPESFLQDKSGRYYFKNSLPLMNRQIYISPMDLNVEKGEIEKPFKPVMRFSTPIFSSRGEKSGIVILNLLGIKMFHRIDSIKENNPGEISILNENGYWLYGPVKEDLWGFMIKDRTHKTFDEKYPGLWEGITTGNDYQVSYNKDLFTSRAIYFDIYGSVTFGEKPTTETTKEWYIISRVPAKDIDMATHGLRSEILLGAFFIILFMSYPVYIFAKLFYQRIRSKHELYIAANYDSLTGLGNRELFYRNLKDIIHHAKRYKEKFALLFIDIDGFKSVNDTLGHDTGDQLLVSIARRLQESVRESDIIARLGGDEFVIILKKIDKPEDAGAVAKKIIHTVSDKHLLDSDLVVIGASIGISLFPDNGTSPDLLVKKADAAMYECKNQGKNRYCISSIGVIF